MSLPGLVCARVYIRRIHCGRGWNADDARRAGCVRLWDVRRASDDPLNGRILAQGVDDVATFALGDIYKGEIPIILCVQCAVLFV